MRERFQTPSSLNDGNTSIRRTLMVCTGMNQTWLGTAIDRWQSRILTCLDKVKAGRTNLAVRARLEEQLFVRTARNMV